jgi:hypothetical protein
MRVFCIAILFVNMLGTTHAQILPEFWCSADNDTIVMIEPRGESSTHAFTYIYILGAPMEGNKKQIRWFRAFMDSTKNKSLTGYDLIPADTIKKYNFTLKAELLPRKIDSLDIQYVDFETQEIKKGQDSTVHIFSILFRLLISVGRELVIETRGHHYEYIGTSVEESYEKPFFTIYGWNVPGKKRQIWMLGTGDFYQDVPRNSVMTFPVNYFGFR